MALNKSSVSAKQIFATLEQLSALLFRPRIIFFQKNGMWVYSVYWKLDNADMLDLCVQSILWFINQLLQAWHKKCYATFFEW